MSEFQGIRSAWPTMNELLAPRAAYDAHQNALMSLQTGQQALQHGQQAMDAVETEYAARAASVLLGEPDPARRAAMYPGILQALPPSLRGRAPASVPDEPTLRMLSGLGTPSATLGEQALVGGAASNWRGGGGAPGPQSSAAPAGGGTTAADTSGTPFAANNPLNIRYVGQEGATNTRGFAAWPTPEAGQAATDQQLASYADKGINTLSGLISRWAPPSENDTAGYIAKVAKATGLDPGAPLDLRNPTVRATVQKAMAVVEGNRNSPGVAQQASAAPVAPADGAAPTAPYQVAGAVVGPPGGAPGADLNGPRPLPPIGPGSPVVTPQGIANTPVNAPPPVQQAQAAPAQPSPAAAPTAPPVAQMPAELRTQPDGLTASDVAEFDRRAAMTRTRQGYQALLDDVQQRKAFNAGRQDKWAEQQRQQHRDALAEETAQRARDEATQKAQLASLPFHGNAADVQDRNILIEGTKSGKVDTVEYASAYGDYAAEKRTDDGRTFKPDMRMYAVPTWKPPGGGEGGLNYGKSDVSQGAAPPPVIATAMLGNVAGLRNIDNALKELDAHPDSVGLKGLQPNFLLQRYDPEGIRLRADVGDILSQVFHDRSGAAVMVSEAQRMKPFVPDPTDTASALRTKLERMRDAYAGVLSDHYGVYGPEGGGRKIQRVEDALKTIADRSAAPAASGGWSVKRLD